VLGSWLRGTGANAVDGALTTYYTDIQTGVSDGVLSLALGVLPIKLYEVAPYITAPDAGTVFSGAIAINKDSWNGLPEEVQNAMIEAGQVLHRQPWPRTCWTRHEFALNKMDEAGRTPVRTADAEEREEVGRRPAEHRRRMGAGWRTRGRPGPPS
jgi:TRAP-type transport system periplasmic protein